LVKLRGGEYVSLTKVEMVINKIPIVENSCLCASASAEYTVLFICPNTKQMPVSYLLSTTTFHLSNYFTFS
jgi:long-subunit acyl-CoA synthetase (AMP-forming)